MRPKAQSETRSFVTNFDDASAGLTPIPYSTITTAGGNTMARSTLLPLLPDCQQATLLGASTDCYGRMAFTQLVCAAGRVFFKFRFSASLLPYTSGSGVGSVIARLDHSGGGTGLFSIMLWRDGSGIHQWRLFWTPTGTGILGTVPFTAAVIHDVGILLDATVPGSERIELHVDGVTVVSHTIGVTVTNPSAIVVGSRLGTAIPQASTFVFANISVYQEITRRSAVPRLGAVNGVTRMRL